MLDFEKCLSDFIDRHEYDQAENALFSIVRISFKAGWLAAGGNPPSARKVIEFVRPERKVIPFEGHPDEIKTDIKLNGEEK